MLLVGSESEDIVIPCRHISLAKQPSAILHTAAESRRCRRCRHRRENNNVEREGE